MTCRDCIYSKVSLDGCMYSADPDQDACRYFLRDAVIDEEDEDEAEEYH